MSKKKNLNHLSVATWNINSVRLRSGLVQKYLKEAAPDVLFVAEYDASGRRGRSAAHELEAWDRTRG